MLTTLVHIVLIWIHTITIYISYVFKNYYTPFNIHISRIYYVSSGGTSTKILGMPN